MNRQSLCDLESCSSGILFYDASHDNLIRMSAQNLLPFQTLLCFGLSLCMDDFSTAPMPIQVERWRIIIQISAAEPSVDRQHTVRQDALDARFSTY
jgi:hypothetical protein